MDFSLYAISPVDGRYRKTVVELASYFSEAAIIRYRVRVEAEYFIALCGIPVPQLAGFDPQKLGFIRDLYLNFTEADALRVKAIEKETNHDVKAVEYFLREQFDREGLGAWKEFIHFGLTSQDINNTAFPMALRDAWNQAVLPLLQNVIGSLTAKAVAWARVPMLAFTHGQPASPTTAGKEIQVFVERLTTQTELMKTIPFCGKFGGATGNFNAHAAAYPEIDWPGFADGFLSGALNLKRLRTTTQIEHYDNMAAFFDNLKRINTILTDLDRDAWSYISMGYFGQKVKESETGSSVMPHKVNPIDFENSEGNLGMANAILEHLSAKLPVSRLQRDLTDSTVTRNIGVPLAHSMIGYKSLLQGLEKIYLNEEKLREDLERNWAVVSEAIQTILRREGYPNPYEALKDLTRGKKQIDRQAIHDFIDTLNIRPEVKTELKKITPANYTGIIEIAMSDER